MIDSALNYFRVAGLPPHTCSACGANNDVAAVFPLAAVSPLPHLCLACLVRIQEADQLPEGYPSLPNEVLTADVDALVADALLMMGLAPDEVAAQLDRVSDAITGAVPPDVLDVLKTGAFPKTGFGLGGVSGVGKTSGIAAILRLMLTNNFRTKGPISPHGWFTPSDVEWVCWPTLAQRWRLNPLASTEEMISVQRRMSSVRLLVLDDVGRESRKDPESDRVVSVLDAVITTRDRQGLPTIWTTNLTEAELVTLYGASLVRRLKRLNPYTSIANAPLI